MTKGELKGLEETWGMGPTVYYGPTNTKVNCIIAHTPDFEEGDVEPGSIYVQGTGRLHAKDVQLSDFFVRDYFQNW